jgi:peptidoglycan glycosyltransferase
MNRSIRRLYLTMAGGFALLLLMLGYWQVVDASDLRDRPGNPQTLQAERLIDRGKIISADGQVLATTRARRVHGQKVYERVYPRGTLAAHVVGYSSEREGKTGIEATYNRYLTGSFGTEPLLQRLNLKEKAGADVRLSLDTRVQEVAEEALGDQRGAVVALDPRTGQVIAMASTPGFDLSKVASSFPEIASQQGAPLLNRAVQGLYPPGSTFKVVTATSALDSGVYQPDTEFPGGSVFNTPGGPIRNFGNQTFGRHTLTTALTKSINTTFATIGDVLGPERLGATMTAFGFGERPPIDLPDVQVSGRRSGDKILPNDQEGEDTPRIAIGQEQLTVTPLQMAMVAGAIADGGTLMAPRLMERITDRGGSVVQRADPQEISQVTSPENAAAMTSMMEDVVREGTGTAAALSSAGVTVAGKTGTAETDNPEKNQAWFIGFAPSRDPAVAVAVVVEDTPSEGGTVAAPIAAQVMRAVVEARP